MEYDPFQNLHKFQDDVWGQIRLNDVERDIIDTPEYQRLFRTSQLGFVELVYHTANHTRGAHSIGACRITDRLINRLVENTKELHRKFHDYPGCKGLYADFEISLAERVLIRLGALLHDISHVPLSHDLEKKSHKIFYLNKELKLRSWYGHYEKHDDWEDNPLLFRTLCNQESSVLARVLRHYSAAFWELLKQDAVQKKHKHLKKFVDHVCASDDVDWKPEKDLLPQLVFHLLFYEKEKEAENPARKILASFDNHNLEEWHLGPKSLTSVAIEEWHNAWYQPFRHDIIGNTLSADLVDYLTRDPQRLGTQRRVDLHLLSYYALVNPDVSRAEKKYRCAIDLHDHKRGTTRTFLLNDLFRLLDLRQDIHEKAVVHRVVQSANSMLARGLLLLGKEGMPGEDLRPKLKEIVGLGDKQHHALQSEDLLFKQLLDISASRTEKRFVEAGRIFEKLTERRVCRPLVVIPGDWARDKLSLVAPQDSHPDFQLRTLAAIVDSAYYSPFLLFVCSCIEEYLEGIFDTDGDLCKYANRIGSDEASPELVEKARNLIPSRVIVWTMPYKQLYKDPGIVVALDECVGQIDSVVDRKEFPKLDKSTRERIETAIGDADSKYATLWQLYVFISDGLFYSGVLNKLLGQLPPECSTGKKRDKHVDRLKNAQAFLPLAFKTLCNDWHGVDQKNEDVEKKQQILNERMNAQAFQEIVGAWAAACRHKNSWPSDWSTVDVMQYYHECAHEGQVLNKEQRPCRDSRYKFDRFATGVWALAEADSASSGYKLIQFLKKCRIEEPTALSKGEFIQLVALYEDADTRKRCDKLAKTVERDPTQIPAALKALFAADFPLIERSEATAQSEPFLMPAGRVGIREWVLAESAILQPNVRRNVTEDIESIVDVLDRAAQRHGRAVFDDFQLRMRNESTLLWNDVRDGRVVNALRRKWNFLAPDSTDGTDDKREKK
jgi:HD superfamily phosphohydrolase